jgi:hypothetical protein
LVQWAVMSMGRDLGLYLSLLLLMSCWVPSGLVARTIDY